MHKISICVLSLFVLILTCTTVIAQTEKPGKYRADAVIVLHGFGGSFGSQLFCNNQDAIRRFEYEVRQQPLHFIAINVPSGLVVDPILHSYESLVAELKERFAEVSVIPWDWRRGVEYNVSTYALPEYQRLVQAYRRVHFVGHSTGGLLIRELLARQGDEHLGRVAFCGVPHKGLAAPYLAWNGGELEGLGAVFGPYTRLIFKYIKIGCGCADTPFTTFLREGCASYPYPMQSLRDLIPIYGFLRKGPMSQIGILESHAGLCHQNRFLAELDTVDRPWDTSIRAHYFVGKSHETPYYVSVKKDDKQCSRLKWPDGKYQSTFYKVLGDKRVLASSGCPTYRRGYEPPQCTFVDTVTSRRRLFSERKNDHGNCTTVFKEEIANFLEFGRITRPPTTTTSTITTTTIAVTTTTAQDPTTTLPVTTTTTTMPSGGAEGVILGVVTEDGLVYDDMLDLVYHQRVVVALADLDGDGELDDDVALHPNTGWSADDARIIQFYPDGTQMTYVGFLVGTTTMRVSFDPDGDGPIAPYTDAMSITIDDGSYGGG